MDAMDALLKVCLYDAMVLRHYGHYGHYGGDMEVLWTLCHYGKNVVFLMRFALYFDYLRDSYESQRTPSPASTI